jgi:hypothetical protein
MDTDNARKIALGFGVVYLAVGVLGFVPGITVPSDHPGHGLLLGIFAVNTLHNLVHLLAGAGLVAAGISPAGTARTLRWALAAVFAVLIPASFIAPIMEAVPLNLPDTLLHTASALLTGYLASTLGEHRSIAAR